MVEAHKKRSLQNIREGRETVSERVAIYCRLSEEDKNKQNSADDSISIQNQKAMLLEYAANMGWELYDVYSDDDYAGSDRTRPEFRRLLEDAEAKRFDVILCKTQSRFTRELELVERYIHGLFPLWGIRFVSIVDNADTANKGNKKSRQINGLVNEWYLEDMSESIKSALDSRRKNGFHIGSFALYGYKKDPDRKGHLIIDEKAAAVVREVFELFSIGYGKTAIARILNDRGVPNPTEYKRQEGLRFKLPPSKNSTAWKYFAISSMLTNEIYIGNMVQGKYESISYKTSKSRPRPRDSWYVVEGTHEPIIERELWDRVQGMIAERSKPFACGKVGIFAGKVHCASCGYVMRSSKSKGKHYLQCQSRHFSRDSCVGAFISVERLEKTVLDELRWLTREYIDLDELAHHTELFGGLNTRKKDIETRLKSCEKKLGEYSRGLREIYLDKVKGIIAEAAFVELSGEFSNQKQKIEENVIELKCELSEIETKLAQENDRRELIEKCVNLEHLTREAVLLFVDKIVVGKRISGTRNIPVEIHWNF